MLCVTTVCAPKHSQVESNQDLNAGHRTGRTPSIGRASSSFWHTNARSGVLKEATLFSCFLLRPTSWRDSLLFYSFLFQKGTVDRHTRTHILPTPKLSSLRMPGTAPSVGRRPTEVSRPSTVRSPWACQGCGRRWAMAWSKANGGRRRETEGLSSRGACGGVYMLDLCPLLLVASCS